MSISRLVSKGSYPYVWISSKMDASLFSTSMRLCLCKQYYSLSLLGCKFHGNMSPLEFHLLPWKVKLIITKIWKFAHVTLTNRTTKIVIMKSITIKLWKHAPTNLTPWNYALEMTFYTLLWFMGCKFFDNMSPWKKNL